MTQLQLSEACGIPNRRISAYEKGTDNMSALQLYAIANALGMNVGDFFVDLQSEQ